MSSAIVLFSGGADSLLMLHLACQLRTKVIPITFHYGQVHCEEIEYAKRILNHTNFQHLRTEHLQVDLSGAFAISKSKLKGDDKTYPGVHEMHLPGRNGVFLSVALGLAEAQEIEEVWIGCDYSDRVHLFPDCYQEWIVKINEMAAINGSRSVKIIAPLLGLSKELVIQLLEVYLYDLKDVYSGYQAPSKG